MLNDSWKQCQDADILIKRFVWSSCFSSFLITSCWVSSERFCQRWYSTHFVPQNKVRSSISSSLWYWYVIYDLSILNNIFFCPFSILQYKFLSYREVLHVLSELSELSKLSELIELPEVFSSMKKCLLHSALRPGDLLLELRLVFWSSETSRSFGTSQSSISSHPAFPDVEQVLSIWTQSKSFLLSAVVDFSGH